uniref:Uncharacterized protein n=1 Tax=viral metagenome TaxID=1070528 RepID=A0A6M3J2S7_9ZZZZ
MADFLSGYPQAAFAARMKNLPRPMGEFFGYKFNDIYNEYLAKMPGNPTLSFSSYLQNYPFLQNYGGYAPRQKGQYQSSYSPPARFLNY